MNNTAKKSSPAWLQNLRGAVGRERKPASRSYRYMAQLIERTYPAKQGGVALGFTCTDGDALGADVMLMQASCLRSEIGASVLLIDARARDLGGGLTARLGLEGKPGYAQWLENAQATLEPLVVETGAHQVAVIPQGNAREAIIIHRARLEALIAAAKGKYDYVLLQLGSVIDDTRNLVTATHADAVMLVASEDHTLIRELTQAQELLRSNGTEDVRVVLAAKPA